MSTPAANNMTNTPINEEPRIAPDTQAPRDQGSQLIISVISLRNVRFFAVNCCCLNTLLCNCILLRSQTMPIAYKRSSSRLTYFPHWIKTSICDAGKQSVNLEIALSELEKPVKDMGQGNCSLEASHKWFKRGTALAMGSPGNIAKSRTQATGVDGKLLENNFIAEE